MTTSSDVLWRKLVVFQFFHYGILVQWAADDVKWYRKFANGL